METKICKSCSRELPMSEFKTTRWGTTATVCNECVAEKRAQTRYERTHMGGGKQPPFSDPDFDGREPREVLLMMGRAKKWLESRGFTIQLSGEYRKIEIKKVKFE